jgi:hypothetical protein
MSDEWFGAYDGQSTDDLLALGGTYRIDSLVAAFEEALQQQAAARPLSREERYVLAIEALEREVNNGGYGQFFLNASHEFIDVIEQALLAIDCPTAAAITREAIAALGIEGDVTGERAEAVVLSDDAAIREALERCDDRFHGRDEPIADRLFAWIKRHRSSVRIGRAS